MLRALKEPHDCTIGGDNGVIGHVKDLFLNDEDRVMHCLTAGRTAVNRIGGLGQARGFGRAEASGCEGRARVRPHWHAEPMKTKPACTSATAATATGRPGAVPPTKPRMLNTSAPCPAQRASIHIPWRTP